MEFLGIILFVAAIFGLCFLVDKGFTKLFRSQAQHYSGLSIRLNKKYGAFGLIRFVVGLAAVFTGLDGEWVLTAGGVIVMLIGIALVVYYMTFGIFYDADSFLYTSFGKRSVTYRYNQISGQKLYVVQGGNVLVELHMTDGKTVSVQLQLDGADKFMDTAFLGWVRQKNLDLRVDPCDFHDPEKSLWFPTVEDI